MTSQNDWQARRSAPLRTPSDILPESVKEIAGALNMVLADVFALYLKTKNFHWHMSGPTFAITICFSMIRATRSSR